MSEITTLSVESDVAKDVRKIRDSKDHENTSVTLRQLLMADGE